MTSGTSDRRPLGPGNWLRICLPLALTACPGGGGPDASLPPLPELEAHVDVPDAASAPVNTVLPAFVLNSGGAVEIKHAGSQEWVVLKIGDPLQAGDQIRTSGDGTVQLKFDVGNMVVKEGSTVTLKFLDPQRVGAELSGRAEAIADGGVIFMQGVGSEVMASTDGGRYSIFADGKGGTAVAALEGPAVFSGTGGSQQLRAGEFVTAKVLRMFRKYKIPARVGVRVEWPPDADPGAETNKTVLKIRGRATAMADVTVQGKAVTQGADGAFEAEVPLHKGKQRIVVVATDPLGRRSPPQVRLITMDPDAPDIKGRVRY